MLPTDILLHPQTAKNLSDFLGRPSHALMIVGPTGSGKSTLAARLACELIKTPQTGLDDCPNVIKVSRPKDKQEISIDKIREVIRALRLKVLRDQQRLILIEDAQALSHEAQNALLKVLEEPSQRTIFILTAVSKDSVLPTIVSRTQQLIIHPASLPQAVKHYQDKFSTKDIESAWMLSQGYPGLLNALLNDEQEHPLKVAVEQAKQIVAQSTYERLLTFEKIGNDKTQLGLVLDALSRVLSALHRRAVDKDNAAQAKSIAASRRLVNDALQALQTNTSTKLITLNLALRLPG
jgi:DNA polymerase III subunit delta'